MRRLVAQVRFAVSLVSWEKFIVHLRSKPMLLEDKFHGL